ncbi:hypothetical protein [Novosphingobium huizhouense]|uniref:hypothetical protein n=1 Tax=Novosphingobium huizhouense TaxID=2866625 RepID=UPI001CD8DA95|nr:hypothetical protein [Novosphingobium huizhouense]
MIRAALPLAGALVLAPLVAAPARAQTSAAPASATATASAPMRVDDTGTFVLNPYLEMKWLPKPGNSGSRIVEAGTKVSVQLNLAPYIGRTGRIYMVLPRGTGTSVRAIWTSGGKLLPGQLLSGERALVYNGAVRGPLLTDLLDLRLQVDSTRLVQPQALAFGFEIEVDP